LNVHYKNTQIKQYHKENRALRTEPTINNSYDFGIGKHPCHLSKLREVGFAANRRLLDVEHIGRDCILAGDAFLLSTARSRKAANVPRACALPTPASTRCCMPSSCSVPPACTRLPLERPAPTACRPVRPRSGIDLARRDHLPTAPSAPPRFD
jgi:hypothetical protein